MRQVHAFQTLLQRQKSVFRFILKMNMVYLHQQFLIVIVFDLILTLAIAVSVSFCFKCLSFEDTQNRLVVCPCNCFKKTMWAHLKVSAVNICCYVKCKHSFFQFISL